MGQQVIARQHRHQLQNRRRPREHRSRPRPTFDPMVDPTLTLLGLKDELRTLRRRLGTDVAVEAFGDAQRSLTDLLAALDQVREAGR